MVYIPALMQFALQVPSVINQQNALLPLVFAALLLDGMIVGIWWICGYLINNSSVKAGARGELNQLIGTAIFIPIIIFSLSTFSNLFQSTLAGSSLMSKTALTNLCNNVASPAPGGQTIDILSTSGGFGIQQQLCEFVTGTATSVQISCSNGTCTSSPGPPLDTLTSQIDYPLAASGIILMNVTYQTIINLNDLFVIESYIGFMYNLAPTFEICFADEPPDCLVPALPDQPEEDPPAEFSWTGKPYQGLIMVWRGLGNLAVLFTTAVQSLVIQLEFVQIFLYIWPFLIFGGLVLRSTFVTRKLGGLFIAIGIGAVFFYPLVTSIQYLTLGNGFGNIAIYSPSNIFSSQANSISSIYGYNSLLTSPITSLPSPSGGTYVPNFYVMPSLQAIAQSNSCWPPNGASAGATQAEAADIAFELIPGVSLAELESALIGGFLGSYPFMPLPNQCSPNNAVALIFQVADSFGVYGITAYLLPILDVLITITAIIGLSGLLGGDVELAGLARFV